MGGFQLAGGLPTLSLTLRGKSRLLETPEYPFLRNAYLCRYSSLIFSEHLQNYLGKGGLTFFAIK